MLLLDDPCGDIVLDSLCMYRLDLPRLKGFTDEWEMLLGRLGDRR